MVQFRESFCSENSHYFSAQKQESTSQESPLAVEAHDLQPWLASVELDYLVVSAREYQRSEEGNASIKKKREIRQKGSQLDTEDSFIVPGTWEAMDA